jgi:hypothetical protein
MESNMNKSYGNTNVDVVECINPRLQKYRVRFDVRPYINNEDEEQGVSFMEVEILHKPTLSEVKKMVLDGYNAITDENILKGFIWRDMTVWLSSENQFNYKAAYDLAVQTNGASLPTVFKFGTTEEPIYHKFDTLEELQDFYIKAMTYINEQLAIGWAKKDAIDWSVYEKALAEL